MSTGVDRRKFLKYTGAAGAATGAAWVAPSVLGSSSAFAAGSCDKKDQIDWTQFANGAFDMTNGGTFKITPKRTVGGGTVNYQVTVTVTPKGSVTSRSAAVNDGNYGNFSSSYLLQVTADSGSTGFGYDIDFSWPTGFHAFFLNYSIGDVDEGPNVPPATGDFVDNVYTNRPFGGSDPGATFNGLRIAGNGTSGQPWHGIDGPKANDTNLGNINIGYAQATELSSLLISFRGDDTRKGALQQIAIGNLTWCL